MELDPELLKQLLDTFKTELDEQLQLITNGLLMLEKEKISLEMKNKIITEIFRSAHNIKGASRGLGISSIGEIAHRIESLFASIKEKSIQITPQWIDLCLDAADKMRVAMRAFLQNEPLPFDLQKLLHYLEKGEIEAEPSTKKDILHAKKTNKTQNKNKPDKEYMTPSIGRETIRIFVSNIDKISAIMEELQVNKIAIDDHYRS